jgi:MFS family permease|tara:strand:- start:1310 stop:2566 length:1257 start_codon:yes stop_codon:yes gene_type:complete
MQFGFGQELRYGGMPLIGSMLGAGCGLSSISFYTHGVFVSAISHDTGWSRGDIQLGVSIMILIAIFTAPAIGILIDRFGARRIALISMPLYGISLASFSLVKEALWSYYLVWLVMSIIAAGTLPVTWTRVVNGWFDKYRGIALGITLAGTGIAATLGPSYVTWLVSQVGWRNSYLLLSLTIMVIALPAVYFLFSDPPNKIPTTLTQKENSNLPKQLEVPGIPFGKAIASYQFWAMGIALIFAASGISGLITNSVPLLIDQGISTIAAAQYAGIIGLSVISGRLIVGILIDHFWAPLIASIFLCAPAFSALVLSGSEPSSFFISISMIVIGLSAGAELDLLAFLASRYFGLKHYGKLYGALYVFFSIGAGIAPVSFGKAFDYFGNYTFALSVVAIMSILSGFLMLTLGRYPQLTISSNH